MRKQQITELRERGTVTLVLGVAVVLFAATGLGLAKVGAAVLSDARARDAADAVALAGGLAGRDAAADTARRNGVELVGWVERDDAVEVRIRRGGVEATASATASSTGRPITVVLDVPVDQLP